MSELQTFLDRATEILRRDERIVGLCVGGSWLANEVDEFSDLDLVVVSNVSISQSRDEMKQIASRLGTLVAGFTGEHVGEPRVLICLYDNPVLHVDLKFVQLHEFNVRAENPVVVWERDHAVTKVIQSTTAQWPSPDFQWIEDRFWVWIHYGATKLARGEYFEVVEFLSFLRITVLGPLLHMKYNSKPRGVRKMEMTLKNDDLEKLKKTYPRYSPESIRASLHASIDVYRELRDRLFGADIVRLRDAERVSTSYLDAVTKAARPSQ